ncbi:hypothetical protein [Nocardia macrotermitis]|uniref:Uncharacterized protein n=1 Tax=Nocardia macrotermitis TaxID=2585198 RepID=A0A7K0D2C1_9NOCA|nr:hypothetical protein [Nocardia macrotermitis]MQY19873.1 hypothetical protein [Nocardia macrotermitis]
MVRFVDIQDELGEHMPGGFVGPLLVVFGLIIALAVLVLLLVSGAHFGDQQSSILTTPGTCAPFCAATPTPSPVHPS